MPIPATFVIARNGLITARFIDPDYRKRMAVEDLLAALKPARNQDQSGQKSLSAHGRSHLPTATSGWYEKGSGVSLKNPELLAALGVFAARA